MEYQYCVVETTYITDKSSRKSYGIAAVEADEEDDSITVLKTVADLCGDYKAVSDFTKLCNDLELDVIHLQDAVEDFIAEL